MKKWLWILLAGFILLAFAFINRVNYKKEKLFKDEGKAVSLPKEKTPENLPALEPPKARQVSIPEKERSSAILPALEPRSLEKEQKEREALGITPSEEEMRELEQKNVMLN